MTPAEREIRQRLKDDFPHYAPRCLTIRTKEGSFEKLDLNRSQMIIHERLSEQIRMTGRVRALILKARQMGASTYTEGRFYWRVSHSKGVRAFILTHEQAATDNLFEMTERYHQHCPELVKPATGASNAKELHFSGLDSGFKVATAGTRGVARSSTIQFFHGSEVGFWPNAESHVDGALQAVPDMPGTEVILESTANGIGNLFHSMWKAAERGESDFIAIFVPWFAHEEYESAPPPEWEPSAEWAEYAELHELTRPQLYWAYRKNRDMARASGGDETGPCWKFRQEYPATADEAFQTAGETAFIKPEPVTRARKAHVTGQGPVILGVDPARGGGDRTGVIDRQGRRAGQHVRELWDDADLMVTAGRVAQLMDRIKPAKCFIDATGLGAGVYDRLRELGYRNVEAVNFGSRPLGLGPNGNELYTNRRSEMWDLMRDWFEDPAGVQIPDDDALHGDLTAVTWGKGATRFDSANRLVLEAKDHIRERGLPSPDLADALALTFAAPVSQAKAQSFKFTPQKVA